MICHDMHYPDVIIRSGQNFYDETHNVSIIYKIKTDLCYHPEQTIFVTHEYSVPMKIYSTREAYL